MRVSLVATLFTFVLATTTNASGLAPLSPTPSRTISRESTVEPNPHVNGSENVQSMANIPHENTLIVGTGNGRISFWRLDSEQWIQIAAIEPSLENGHQAPVSSLVWLAATRTLVSTSHDGKIMFTGWNNDQPEFLHHIKTQENGNVLTPITSLTWHPYENIFVIGTHDAIIAWLYDGVNATPIQTIPFLHRVGERVPTHRKALWDPKGEILAAAYDDGYIDFHRWSDNKFTGVSTTFEENSLSKHIDGILCIAWSPDATMLVSASYDAINCWDVSGEKAIWQGRLMSDDEHKKIMETNRLGAGAALSLLWHPNNENLFVGFVSGDIHARQRMGMTLPPLQIIKSGTQQSHNKAVSALVFDRENSVLISGSWDNTVKFWQCGLPMNSNIESARSNESEVAHN